jgi:molybdopterin-containing oxidoreductase family iron-sulfur binding subunit
MNPRDAQNPPSEPDASVDTARRGALTTGALAMAGLMVAPGMRLIAPAQARAVTEASSTVRWGMLVDATRCADGCTACVDACKTENGFDSGIDLRQRPQWIRKIEIKEIKTGRTASLPIMCQHCEEPPCVDVCPTGASFKRPDGIVLVDRHACIGCRYCMMACPYKARSFVHEPVENQKPGIPRGQGTVESCTFCVHRIDQGGTPACVEACAHEGNNAIVFGDLNDPKSEIAQKLRAVPTRAVREDLDVHPAVRYEGI